MAKLEKNVTVTVKTEHTEVTYKAPDASLSGSVGVFNKKHLSIQLFDYETAGTTTKIEEEEPQEVERDSAHEQKVQEHANVISGVLKQMETTQLNAAIKREHLESEIANQLRADRVALRIATHNAIQAGLLDCEELSANMTDDWAGYVADMYEQVYVLTDLDTVVHMEVGSSHE